MKNICKKIKISFFFLLLIFLSLISGLFKDIICLFLIIIIHEMGHIITSLIYKWDIKRIDITVCGGFITYNEPIDKPFIQELLIAVSGMFIQIIFYFICFILNKIGAMDMDIFLLFKKYNYSILLFNLLPVFPLDGSKILNIFLNMYLPYKKSLKIMNLISIINILLIIFILLILKIKIEYSYIIILSFILSKIIHAVKDVPFLFNRFLFERYKNPIKINKYFYIKNNDVSKMKRQVKNYFYINGKYYKEIDVLRKRFD